ncbi:glycosyltransferase [Sutcliffiella horikoshii]|uniref:Glycosyltransferase n=1 Tax=Sutcliffiella horikoshii TaxID=79883 RepID=A0A5D4T375_9BACI|nr:glycosyltransferase [Sutcliffiella horikoshii]TYS69845.1 glycosyltransferase [Sutcliffiella horikoshii]
MLPLKANNTDNKVKVLLFGFIDMNAMDGSAVFLTSLSNTLAKDKNIQVDLLLARPIIRDFLVKPLEQIENVNVINPFQDEEFINCDNPWKDKGFLNYEIVEMLISHYWKKNDYDWLIVRSMETVIKLLNHKEIINKTLVYATGLTHMNQSLSNKELEVIKSIYNQSAYFLCQTNEMKQFVINLLSLDDKSNKVEVLTPMIPDIVEENVINEIKTSNKNKLVYTGKFDPKWKTIEIITAFKELKREINSLTLDIAGDKFNKDPNNPFFQEESIYLMKETEGVSWYGAVPREKAQELIIDSDIGITWRSTEMDISLELSTKLLEYGILKKAVIMNPTDMHKEIFGEDYPLYAVTEKDFREKIKLALLDKEVYNFAADRMYEVSKQFVFSQAIKGLQPLLWKEKTRLLIEQERKDGLKIFANSKSTLINRIINKNFQDLTSKSKLYSKNIYVIEKIENETIDIKELLKLSKVGIINNIETLGCLRLIYFYKNNTNFEKNLEENLKFVNRYFVSHKSQPIKNRASYMITDRDNNSNLQTKELNLKIAKLSSENANLKIDLNHLMKKNLNLEKRYKALSNSKFGKLTIKYWKYKKEKQKNTK